jgi:hypothetical protein
MRMNYNTPQIGDKVKVVGVSSGHSIPVGTVGTISHTTNNNRYWYLTGYTSYLNLTDFTVVEPVKVSREQLESRLSDAQEEVNTIKSQINYMEETESKFFCNDEWRIYCALKVFESRELDRVEKAKAIAELVRRN